MDKLLDMTLREVLENYCLVFNPECCFYYGIFKIKDIDKLYKEYNIEEDYPEAFCPESMITDEVIDLDEPVRDYDVLLRIMDNLGISKKK